MRNMARGEIKRTETSHYFKLSFFLVTEEVAKKSLVSLVATTNAVNLLTDVYTLSLQTIFMWGCFQIVNFL